MTRKGVGKRLLCLAGAPRATPPLIPGATKEPQPLDKHMTTEVMSNQFPTHLPLHLFFYQASQRLQRST